MKKYFESKAFDKANSTILVDEYITTTTQALNKVCIVVTHDERLKAYCDKVYNMQDGILKLEK